MLAFKNETVRAVQSITYQAKNIKAISKGSDQTVCLHRLVVATTTLLEISCCGLYTDLLAALQRNASTSYNRFILVWS